MFYTAWLRYDTSEILTKMQFLVHNNDTSPHIIEDMSNDIYLSVLATLFCVPLPSNMQGFSTGSPAGLSLTL